MFSLSQLAVGNSTVELSLAPDDVRFRSAKHSSTKSTCTPKGQASCPKLEGLRARGIVEDSWRMLLSARKDFEDPEAGKFPTRNVTSLSSLFLLQGGEGGSITQRSNRGRRKTETRERLDIGKSKGEMGHTLKPYLRTYLHKSHK